MAFNVVASQEASPVGSAKPNALKTALIASLIYLAVAFAYFLN
jgi:hypothetical protein